jgi:predicted HicB family RNase H-like nuclease
MKPQSTTVTVRIKEDKKEKLIELAKNKECSLSKYINEVIESHLKKQKK